MRETNIGFEYSSTRVLGAAIPYTVRVHVDGLTFSVYHLRDYDPIDCDEYRAGCYLKEK